MAEVNITPEFIASAMRHEAVRQHLGVIARRIQKRAETLASSEGVDMDFWVEEGTRPKGRPQAIVYGDNAEQEWGSSRADRRRILGRAAEGG